MTTLAQDFRYGIRILFKNPGFTAVAVLALALGIGANTAIFTVVNAVLLRPLPYKDPDRLVVALHGTIAPVAPANYFDWKNQNRVFESMAAAEAWGGNVTGIGGRSDRPEQIPGLRMTADLFPLLGVQPMLGRTFLADEDQAGRERVVVLSHRLWQRRFGGDTGIIGQPLTISGRDYAIIGVMPPEFRFPPFWFTRAEMWAPLTLAPRANDRAGRSLRIFARLKPGVTVQQAQAEMDTISRQLEQAYPRNNRGLRVSVAPLHERAVGNVRPTLLVLLGAVGLVLLIACANVANLLLARITARQKEIAVRVALGAGRFRLVRQLLTESLVLAVLGAAAGLLLAYWGVGGLVANLPEGAMPRQHAIGIDGGALGFALLLSMMTGVIFGLVPALRGSRWEKLQGLSRGQARTLVPQLNLLVVSEIAVALVLLIGAGLMIRSFVRLQAVDPGFQPQNLLTMTVSVAGTAHAEPARRATLFQTLLQRIVALPGVQSAAAVNHLPLGGDSWDRSFTIEGRPAPAPGESPSALYRVVLPNYFHTMGIALEQGRDFNEQDKLNTPGVVIINEAMARRYWPNQDPIGQRIKLGDPQSSAPWLSIVGVLPDVMQREWIAALGNEVYLPYLQDAAYLQNPAAHYCYLTLVVRTASDPLKLTAAIEREIWAVDKSLPLSSITTMDQVISAKTWRPRFSTFLMGSFAVVALILAAVGIYGVMSYAVSQRTNEIGIRMALGARQGDVLRMIVRRGLILVMLGLAIGLIGAFTLTRVLSSLLFGVSPTDPATFAGVAALLALVGLAASYIPARRAVRIDPIVALRHE